MAPFEATLSKAPNNESPIESITIRVLAGEVTREVWPDLPEGIKILSYSNCGTRVEFSPSLQTEVRLSFVQDAPDGPITFRQVGSTRVSMLYNDGQTLTTEVTPGGERLIVTHRAKL